MTAFPDWRRDGRVVAAIRQTNQPQPSLIKVKNAAPRRPFAMRLRSARRMALPDRFAIFDRF
jgi:hypothetical protein